MPAQPSTSLGTSLPFPLADAALTYWVDTVQRCILLADTLRERGDVYNRQAASKVPHVLSFKAELVVDGRTLERPVNYMLVRIVPPAGVEIDHRKRPFIVFDPRAGHGPGIGGMKQDSEIGVALKAGHPCYFVGFLPAPMPGQTIEDVCQAEARFIEAVIEAEPEAQGRPCLIGNCQAGWQIMMTAALRPDLAGPIILAGSPLSYWQGKRGESPMRYLGGMLGGTWLTSLAGDLGHGIFDGAHLIANFEAGNPANTYWRKAYNVFSKIDTEPERFIDFETWWGSPVLLNAAEMQWIADNLFVGNKLGQGLIATSDGHRIDLRNVASPIVVFCSWGDEITPPPQALGWVLDLYDRDEDLVRSGQTIVYSVHQTIGHLGIFVSGKVATKEHSEFATCIDLINLLPPGLYEAVITEVEDGTARPDLIEGKYLLSLQRRTLDAIRALGRNDAEDDRRFRTVARVSEINRGLYETIAAPLVRAAVTEASAKALRDTHPHRLRFSAFSDKNLAAGVLKDLAKTTKQNRVIASPDNPFRVAEEQMAEAIGQAWTLWGAWRDAMQEQAFLWTYGSPMLQALVGLRTDADAGQQQALRDVSREALAKVEEDRLRHDMDRGGILDGVLRACLYIAEVDSGADERGFATLKLISAELPARLRIGQDAFKAALRKQFLTLRLDRARAMETLPALLSEKSSERENALGVIQAMFESRERTEGEAKRLAEVRAIFHAAGPSSDRSSGKLKLIGGQ
jgi:pimeloyl-ACP methyl ester carboxylesterase